MKAMLILVISLGTGVLAAPAPSSGINVITSRGVQLYYSGWEPVQIEKAAIQYFLNQQSLCEKLLLLRDERNEVGAWVVQSFKDESLSLKTCMAATFDRVYDSATYPYNCIEEGSALATRRLDWLIHRLLTAENYHALETVPKTRAEFEDQYKLNLGFGNVDFKRKILDESLVATDIRAVGAIVTDEKLKAILTLDLNREEGKTAAQSYFTDPLNVEVGAAEIFLIKPNRLWTYALYDMKKGVRIDAAPAGVANFQDGLSGASVSNQWPSVRSHATFASIRNGVDCLICHQTGILSSGYSSKNRDIFKKAMTLGLLDSPKVEDLARQLYGIPKEKDGDSSFDPADEVDRILAEGQSSFESALRDIGSFRNSEAVPLLADYAAAYQEPLTEKDIVRETALSLEAFEGKLALDPMLRKLVGLEEAKFAKDISLDRFLFEKNYCAILERFEDKRSDTDLVSTVERRKITYTYYETVDGKPVAKTGERYIDLPAFK